MTAEHRPSYVFHSLSVCAGCGCRGDNFGSVNFEAYELTGELYCEDCAEGAVEAFRDASRADAACTDALAVAG